MNTAKISGNGNLSPVEAERKKPVRKNRYDKALHRFWDVILSLAALFLLWPVMLAVAVLLLLEDPKANPIFAQNRVGLEGQIFTLYKFRSMCPGAEAQLENLMPQNEMQGPVFKIRNDPRVTKVGRFLRRYCLDELPQLWNVLRGEMSIVGPRPALPREVEQYDRRARQRLTVKPGMTCFWQIQPDRNGMSFDRWLELDLHYIQCRSFSTDGWILLHTIGAVLRGNGI